MQRWCDRSPSCLTAFAMLHPTFLPILRLTALHRNVNARRLIVQASEFSHILDQAKRPGEWLSHPLFKLSPSRRGILLQNIARDVLKGANPQKRFEDPSPQKTENGRCLGATQTAWDWTMDGRRVECKSSLLRWNVARSCWSVQFSGVKFAHDGVRQRDCFDDLLLVLLCPDFIDVVEHDARTGVCKAGVSTASAGHRIFITSSCNQVCWKTARRAILDKLCAGDGNCTLISTLSLSNPIVKNALLKAQRHAKLWESVYDHAPLSLVNPSSRGLCIQEIALEIDKMLHPTSQFSMAEGETTVSGSRRAPSSRSVDWIRDGQKVEVKHCKLSVERTATGLRWICYFQGIKCAYPGVREENLYDELWLVIYSPVGLHFLRHHGRLGLSSQGIHTAAKGHVLKLYAPAYEEDYQVALEAILSKLLLKGSLVLATMLWDV